MLVPFLWAWNPLRSPCQVARAGVVANGPPMPLGQFLSLVTSLSGSCACDFEAVQLSYENLMPVAGFRLGASGVQHGRSRHL